MLEAPLSMTELKEALDSMSPGKSPGPDGLPPELLSAFWKQLSTPLFHMLNSAISASHLHPSLNQSLMTLLLKQGKDPSDCSSYRPLSLMNSDIKLFAKVLARRLQAVISKLIHPDQTGFIKSRHAADNIRRLLHVLHAAPSFPFPAALLSLDAEKAFDRMNWSFLWRVLRRMGFGPYFNNLVQTLYSSPSSVLLTNANISPPFRLLQGARQGCPLSPLLFNLSLEPLAAALRHSDLISPILVKGVPQSVSLYADDLLLYLGNAPVDLPHVLNLFQTYESLSGYRINWAKSSLLPLNPACHSSSLPPSIPQAGSFRYLGLDIYPSVPELTAAGFRRVLEGIKASISSWSSLSLSFRARLAVIKMNVLPRINFISSMLPLSPPPGYWASVKSAISTFLWDGKRPSVRHSTLIRDRLDGGVSLPDFEFYHLAFTLRPVWSWISPPQHPPAWLPIEAEYALPHRLASLPFLPVKLKSISASIGPIISQALRTWRRVEKLLGPFPKWHPSVPLLHNPALNIGGRPISSSPWSQSGIFTLGDIFDSSGLKSFQSLKVTFNLPSSSFFFYLQLRSMLRACNISFSSPLPLHPLCRFALSFSPISKPVSSLYSLLRRSSYKPLPIISVWQGEFSPTPVLSWGVIFHNIKNCSKNPNHQQTQFKFVHRLYPTPRKRHLMGLEPDPLCHLCPLQVPGTFLHMFWDCPPAAALWDYVARSLSSVLSSPIPLSPAVLLLLDFSSLSLSRFQRRLLMSASLAAKLLLASRWKSPDRAIPTVWKSTFLDLLLLELSAARINNSSGFTIQSWLHDVQLVEDWLRVTS